MAIKRQQFVMYDVFSDRIMIQQCSQQVEVGLKTL